MSLLGSAGWTVCFLRTNWYYIRWSSQQGLQHAFDRFSVACDQAGTKISTKKLRYCVSQDAQGSVFCKWAEIHCSRWRRSSALEWYWYSRVTEVRTKRLMHGLVKLTQFCVSFIALWWRNGCFQRPQSFQLFNRSFFPSSPVVMNLRWRLKECSLLSKEQTAEMGYLRRVHGVTLRDKEHRSEIREARNVKPLLRIEKSQAMLVRPCIQNVPGKNGEQSPSGYSLHPLESGPGRMTTDYTSDLAWSRLGVEPAERSEIAVDREVFQVVLGLLPLRLSPKKKRSPKWVNELVCRPTLNLSVYEIIFSLFAKSECRIQKIKHIWTETCVFVKIS